MNSPDGLENQLFNSIRKFREDFEKYNRPFYSLSDLLQKNTRIIQESSRMTRTLAEQLSHVLIQQNDKMRVLAGGISSSLNQLNHPDFQKSVRSISEGLANLNPNLKQVNFLPHNISKSINNSVAIAAGIHNISTTVSDIKRIESKIDDLSIIVNRISQNQILRNEDLDDIKEIVVEIKDKPDYSLLYFLIGMLISLLLYFSKSKNQKEGTQYNINTYNTNLEINYNQVRETLNLLDFEVRTNTCNLNLRETPDSTSKSIVTIPSGNILIAVDSVKYWLKVNCEVNDEQFSGWVYKRYTTNLN